MIKIDVSSVLPKRLGTYLLGLIPGMVFELTASFGNPLLAHRMIERVKLAYPFHSYTLLLLFLASCLVIGQTFFLLAWAIDWLIDSLYGAVRLLIFRLTLGSDWLYRAVGRLQGMPPKRNVRLLWRIITWARQERFPFKMRATLKCQRMAATQLLKLKYRVTPSKGQWEWVEEEWQAWLAVLGKAPAGFRESFLTMRTFLGCGLAEYAALYLVPELRNRYFAAMSDVLLIAGCFQSLSMAKRRREPTWFSLTRLLLVMEELADFASKSPENKEKRETGNRLSVALGGESKDSEEDED
jgi:hypothetical protein